MHETNFLLIVENFRQFSDSLVNFLGCNDLVTGFLRMFAFDRFRLFADSSPFPF